MNETVCASEPSEPSGYPDDNPKTVHGLKKPPLGLCPPAAMIEWATAMKLGAEKYGPYNWRTKRVSATVYLDAALRHLHNFLDGRDRDPESRAHELGHVMACCGILIDAAATGQLNDDRPPGGVSAATQDAWRGRFEIIEGADPFDLLEEADPAAAGPERSGRSAHHFSTGDRVGCLKTRLTRQPREGAIVAVFSGAKSVCVRWDGETYLDEDDFTVVDVDDVYILRGV